MQYIPSGPIPQGRMLPRGGKAKQHIYMASFILSWKSVVFWASVVAVFVITIYILG